MTAPSVLSLVIVSPVRDEAKYLRHTRNAVIAQTVRPEEWLFVDDGSNDETKSITGSYTREHSWIRVLSRETRGFRKLGSGVIAAFAFDRKNLQRANFEYIAKLDGDMSFLPKYLKII